MSNPIVLTAYSGGTLGLRVQKADRRRFADRREVVIILPGIGRPSRQRKVVTSSTNDITISVIRRSK